MKRTFCFLFLVMISVCFVDNACAQQSEREQMLLMRYAQKKSLGYYDGTYGNNASPMMQGQRLSFKRVVSAPLSLLMLTYQHTLSPQLPSNCPYALTCSNFSKRAFQEYNMLKAVFLTMDRLYRCNDATHRHAPEWAKTHDGKTLDSVCDHLFR